MVYPGVARLLSPETVLSHDVSLFLPAGGPDYMLSFLRRPLCGLLLLVLGAWPAWSDCPSTDLYPDCRVDFLDVMVLAEHWLDPEESPYDIDGEDGVNAFDFTLLAGNWMAQGPPVLINEFLASNSRFGADERGEFEDWIELYNPQQVSFDAGGLYVTDNLSEPWKWRIPTNIPAKTTIPPHGHLLIWADNEPGDGPLHAPFELDREGERIAVFDADGRLLDSVEFDYQDRDTSFGRYPDGAASWRFLAIPTPGAANNGAYTGEIAPVEISHSGGIYSQAITVSATCETPDVQIYYTTDGTEPYDRNYRPPRGTLYTEPLYVGATRCLRFRAVKMAWKDSPVETRTYVINPSAALSGLPIVSLAGDPRSTFYEPTGIMAVSGGTYGGGGWQPVSTTDYNNFMNRGMAYERPVAFEWIADGRTDFVMDCGIRVHGSEWIRPRYRRCDGYWSGDCKISFRLYFRGRYGSSRLEYPLFPFEVDTFKTVVLRAGHNDRTNPFIKDELLRRIYKDMGNVSACGTFANVLINGEYKGFYNPTEHVKSDFCRQWWDTDNEFDVMTMSGIRDGDGAAWSTMLNYARSHDLRQLAYYDQFATMLDIPAFADYLILQLWCGNWDWPQNNWSAARERSPNGRWQFFIWDAEGGMFPDQVYNVRFGELNSQSNGNAELYRALKYSEMFRQVWADRYFKHFYNGGALTAQNINARFLEMKQQLLPVIANMDMYVVNSWTPQRFSIFRSACLNEGLYSFDGPAFRVNNSPMPHGGYVSPSDAISISNTYGSGTVWYTLDGADPRDFSGAAGAPQAVSLITETSAKKAFVPTEPVSENWRGGGAFDDSAWWLCSGEPGAIGFDYDRFGTYDPLFSLFIGPDMYTRNGSCLIRAPFTFHGSSADLAFLRLRVKYDDGFVAYINGVEVARRNFSGQPAWNSNASAAHPDAQATVAEDIDITAHRSALRDGDNILAVHGLNISATDDDFLINMDLTAGRTAPSGVSASAQSYSAPFTLSGTSVLKARIQSGGTWSALAEAVFAVSGVAENLRITELMYHPGESADPNAADREFIELRNIGSQLIDLNLVKFTRGVRFTFPPMKLSGGAYALIVRNRPAFEARYGRHLPVVGVYDGRLDNAGETLRVEDALGTVIHEFRYRDGWYNNTDGGGFSLTVRNPVAQPLGDYNLKQTWRPSAMVGGSPGYDDTGMLPEPGAVVINEVLAHSHATASDWIELHNTTPEPVNIGGWYLSDSDSDDVSRMRYRIADGTSVPAGGFVVFYENLHFGNAADPGCLIPFALSENGEEIVLSSSDGTGLTGYRDYEDFGPSPTGVAFGRHYKASTDSYNFVLMSQNTPGAANAYPLVGPIVINEIMYNPPSGNQDEEYIELLNISSSPVTLYDAMTSTPWKFTDGIELTFPTSPPLTVKPGEFVLAVSNFAAFTARYGGLARDVAVLEYESGRLANDGERLEIAMPGDVDAQGTRYYIRVDRVNYSDGSHPIGSDPWPTQADGGGASLSRVNPALYGNDVANWTAATPTPGRQN